jgi:hypothetical protein
MTPAQLTSRLIPCMAARALSHRGVDFVSE